MYEAMSQAEAQSFGAHQGVGQFRNSEESFTCATRHVFPIYLAVAHYTCEQSQCPACVLEGREDEWLQIIFAVYNVPEWRVMRAGEHCLSLRECFARQNPRVLQRYRISLLRHDAGGLHERIRQPQKVKLGRTPLQEILHQLAEVNHADGDRGSRLGDIIHRGDGAVGIGLQSLEAQQFRSELAVDGKTRGSDRACTKWIAIDGRPCRIQALEVALQELDRREQVMREGRRLSRLRVGVRRHHRLDVCRSQVEQRLVRVGNVGCAL